MTTHASVGAASGPIPPVAAAEGWGRLVRAMGMYQRGAARTRQSLQAFLDALRALGPEWADEDGSIEIALVRDALYVGRRKVQDELGPNLAWLSERLNRSALLGAAFAPDVAPDALLDFCAMLIQAFARRAEPRTFCEIWGEIWPSGHPGLRPLEMRFAGVFGGAEGVTSAGAADVTFAGAAGAGRSAGEEQVLVDFLLGSPKVADRLAALELAVGDDVRGHQQVAASEVVARIVEVLPIDALEDVSKTLSLTLEVLERLAGRKDACSPDVASLLDERQLNVLIETVGQRFFLRKVGADAAARARHGGGERVSAADRGHAGDEAVSDDLVGFLREYQGLPKGRPRQLTVHDVDVGSEQLGAYLHYLTHLEADDQAARLYAPMNALLANAKPVHLRVLTPYLRSEELGQEGELARRRLASFLAQANTTALLGGDGLLDIEWVVATFPHTFGVYLRRLDWGSFKDLDELVAVCERLGEVRILAAGGALATREVLLRPGVVEALCMAPFRQLLPLVRVILQHSGDELKGRAIDYLLRVGLEGREERLLRLLPQQYVPRSFLLALMDPGGPKPATQACAALSSTIIRFIEDVSRDAGRTEERIAAVRLLGEFPSEEANVFLGLLVERKGLLGAGEPRAVRREALAALRSMATPPVDQHV